MNSRDHLLREIAFLKKLKPSFMWRGGLVHDALAAVLNKARRSTVVPAPTAEHYLRGLAEKQWADSQRRALSSNPKSSIKPAGPILMEHYYQNLASGLDFEGMVASAVKQFRSLYSWIEQNGLLEQVRNAEDVWVEPPSYLPTSPGFIVNGVRFITKVDLATRTRERFEIYDWKAGIEPSGAFHFTQEHRQASFYALWPHLEFNYPVEGIEIVVVYAGKEKPVAYQVRLSPQAVEDLLADAELLIDATSDYLDSDIGFALEDFDWATSSRACLWCPFQQICQRELNT